MGSPVTAKLLSVPLLKVTSLCVKPVGASEKVNVMVAVSPAFSALTLLVMARVGAVVSTVRERVASVAVVTSAATV